MIVHDYLYFVILPMLAVSVILIFFRFLKGPSIVDKVIALDLIITTGIGIITIYSIVSNQSTFLDIAMILALIAFLGTIAFAYYLEIREKNE
jgi:multicomponent Na+:H+ antiporter subunit F